MKINYQKTAVAVVRECEMNYIFFHFFLFLIIVVFLLLFISLWDYINTKSFTVEAARCHNDSSAIIYNNKQKWQQMKFFKAKNQSAKFHPLYFWNGSISSNHRIMPPLPQNSLFWFWWLCFCLVAFHRKSF